MSLSDPIADMLTRVRNAQAARKTTVLMPASKLKSAIAKVLQDEGYIQGFAARKNGTLTNLEIVLKYYADEPVISQIHRISKPGLRAYRSTKALPKVLGGLGIAIVSTSKGVMSDRSARAANLGGEVLCTVE